VQSEALRWLRSCTQRFDVVFLDPPFASSDLARALEILRERGLLAPGAQVYAELPDRAAFVGYEIAKESRAGATRFLLLEAAV
jgi:16S rRNA (guanine966-N2)-methyltransferase